MKNNLGILLTNVGSPDDATPASVRQYLKKFLSDPRIVEIPRWLWWPILYGFILPRRSKKSAKLYQQIWTAEGSPLLLLSEKIAEKLSKQLQLPVALGMHYGNPSIKNGLEKLQDQNIKKIIILPLYPQYSATTTASTFDHVAATLKAWRNIPEMTLIHDYFNNENYIDALYYSIQQHTIKYLVFSFHGIPQRYIDKGDPYAQQCLETVRLVTDKLKLKPHQYSVTFQSRLGRAKWLTPYTDKTFQTLPNKGVTDIHVICPGFAVDCLETLEEINIRGKKQFLAAGGKSFQYIPALNNSDTHLLALQKIIEKCMVS